MNVPPNDFGPAGKDPSSSPSWEDFQRVAIKSLHRETSFVIMNKDNPAAICARLDELASIVIAALEVEGPHRKKAVRLGLALDREYWIVCDKLDDWNNLLHPLLRAALYLREFQSEVYRIWSQYRYVNWQFPGALSAIDASITFAEESGREDLQLLARSDRFNFGLYGLTLEEAEEQAAQLIEDARRLDYRFVWGRAYYTLARAYDRNSLTEKWFECTQQALAILAPTEMELVAESVVMMLAILNRNSSRLPKYQAQLRQYLATTAEGALSPAVEAGLHYIQGLDHFHHEDYENAFNELLIALQKYQKGRFQYSIYRVRHMLGIVETKRRHWEIAEEYLRSAYRGYMRLGDDAYALHALHAAAFIPFEQKNYALTIQKLIMLRSKASRLRELQARNQLVQRFENDLIEVRQHLLEYEQGLAH